MELWQKWIMPRQQQQNDECKKPCYTMPTVLRHRCLVTRQPAYLLIYQAVSWHHQAQVPYIWYEDQHVPSTWLYEVLLWCQEVYNAIAYMTWWTLTLSTQMSKKGRTIEHPPPRECQIRDLIGNCCDIARGWIEHFIWYREWYQLRDGHLRWWWIWMLFYMCPDSATPERDQWLTGPLRPTYSLWPMIKNNKMIKKLKQ